MSCSMGRKRKANFSLPPRMHLKSGTYYYVTNDKPRKWIRLGKDLSAAKKEWARLETSHVVVDALDSLVDEWLGSEQFKSRPEGTQRVYRSIAQQVKAVFGSMSVKDIAPSDIALWMDSHASRSNANAGKTILSNVLKLAVRHGKIDRNPCQEISAHNIPSRKRYITDDEFMRIRNEANPTLQSLMDISYLTGARISDVLAIRLSAWTTDGLTIRQIKTKKLQLFARTPELEQAIDQAKRIVRPARGLYLFCSDDGKPHPQSTVRGWWMKARNAAGVDDVHFHDIRGKSATDAESDGEDYQALLGHASKRMSDKYLKIEKPQKVTPRRRGVGKL